MATRSSWPGLTRPSTSSFRMDSRRGATRYARDTTIPVKSHHAPGKRLSGAGLRILQDQAQFQLAEAEIVTADPLVQLGRGVPLLAQIVGEGEGLAVDIGPQERR